MSDLTTVENRAASLADALSSQRDDLTRRANEASLVAACAAVRREHPDAKTLIINSDFQGIDWAVRDVGGQPVDELDMDLVNVLYEYGCALSVDRPTLLATYARDFDEHDPQWWVMGSDSFRMDGHTGTLESLTVDIDQMLGRELQEAA